jgi:DNA-binding GntR family transcriptional regulator
MRAPRRLLRVDIHEKLREEILACRLSPGADLREQELASRFQVSKSPVRDALLRLEREQLVTIAPRQGYRVAPISLSDARDLLRLRAVLESASAAEAAREADGAELASLDRFRSFRPSQWLEGFAGYNREFHCALARASGNRRMSALTCELIEQTRRLVHVSVQAEPRRTAPLVAEHAAIIDALQDRDGRRASALLRTHIAAAERRVAEALSRAAIVA